MNEAAAARLPEPSSLGAWVLAARPQTLPVAVAPVAVGASVAYASGAPNWLAVGAALFGALMLQVGTNFANDVFDFEKGADDERRLGPPRAVQRGLLTPRAVRIGMAVSFLAAALAGVYLIAVAGWPILVIGVASILSGIAYTGGPYPLGYNRLGAVFVAVGQIPPLAWIASVPVGALATAVLVVNNSRDHVTDVDAGKRTLVVRFGRRFGTQEYVALLASAYLVVLGAIALDLASPFTALTAFTMPMAVSLGRRMAALEGAELNPLLGGTARLLLLHSALLAAGIALGASGLL